MPKYLFEVSYTAEGVGGVRKEGGSSRKTMVEKLVQNLGGTLENFYFAFGDHDVYLIADLPSNTDVAAVSMTVGATGAATVKTVVLMTPEEVDEAAQKTVDYRAPGT